MNWNIVKVCPLSYSSGFGKEGQQGTTGRPSGMICQDQPARVKPGKRTVYFSG